MAYEREALIRRVSRPMLCSCRSCLLLIDVDIDAHAHAHVHGMHACFLFTLPAEAGWREG